MADDQEKIVADAQEAAARVLANRQWPVTLTLQHPVEFDDERITQLVFRRGRMGDLKGMKIDSVPPIDQLLLIASRMCGRPLKVLELLGDDDGADVVEIALSFFARSLGGGRGR